EARVFEQIHHLAQTGGTRPREKAPLNPSGQWRRGNPADAVNQPPTMLRQHALHHVAPQPVILKPDMFQHPNRDKRIELTGDVAVIILDELHSIPESLVPGTLSRKRHLFL